MASSLSDRLARAMDLRGLKQADLRRLAKVKSPSTLSELLSGARSQSPQLPLIAEALGVNAVWLQHGRGEMLVSEVNAVRDSGNAAVAHLEPPCGQFLDRLRVSRKRKGLTQRELAAAAGLTDGAISQMESGIVKNILGENVFPLADALGVSARWLLTGNGAGDGPKPVSSLESVIAKQLLALPEERLKALAVLLGIKLGNE